jgi:hypothetical protein
METVIVERRLTRKYVGTWKHLDAHEYVGRVKLTPHHRIDRPKDRTDPSDGPVVVQHGRLPAHLRTKRQKQEFLEALEDTLSAWGCSHEHDCCGCASYSARARIMKGRRFRITTRVTYNF